ncbi:lectin-4 [Cryptomeria japonica]|uniref:lectin-4 n=1 Tax=Cryptomeria japonica TaxID=3369 RepID=UPI0025ABA199|nr:lectin-4 [Cryptomeria japonica]
MAVSTLTVVTVSVIFHFFVSEISPLDAKNVQVSFELNASSRDRIACDADAKFVSGTLQLTNGRKANETQGSAGRAVYKETIPLWDASAKAVADFTTHFQFQINSTDYGSALGDGFAFFMAPREMGYKVSFRGEGGYLGLFDSDSDGSPSSKLTAVEFDTYKTSPWDADDNHFGIDVNTINSTATRHLDEKLNGGEIWDAQIDYHGRENMLEVLASCRCKHKGPWKSSHKIDLTRYLPEDIVVGFSAAASISSEVYRLLSWNFTSTISRREREFSWKVTVAIDFITSLVITSLISFIIYYKKRCRPTSDSMEDQPESDMEADIDMALDHIPRKFTYEELSAGPNSQEMRVFRALQHLLPLWRPHQQTQVLPNNRKAGSEL